MEEFKRFTLGTISFNQYAPHHLVEDHCTRVYHPWIHMACHWPEEEPWKYCYNFSRLNELVRMVVEWLAVQRVATSQRNRPTLDKGKRKFVDSVEVEQSYKFKVDPLVLRVALEIEEKRRQRDRRITQR